MGKKFVSCIAAMALLAAMGLFSPVLAGEELDVSVSASSAILVEASTGRVLFEKDADTPRPIASTTKLMTALVVLERARLTDPVTVTDQCQGVEGTSMYLKAGDTLTVRELLYGLMLESGNDAAVALAVHVAGSVEAFAGLMNEKAAALGMANTHYVNPHGLTAEGHQSSARDLAALMAACMADQDFVRIASTKTVKVGGRTLKNHNKLLWSYEGMAAGKTGYTKAAGRTLVTCAQRDGLRLICVTLRDGDDWEDHVRLYDAAFERWELRRCAAAGEALARVPVVSGDRDDVAVGLKGGAAILCRRDDETDLRVLAPDFVYAQVRAGDKLGTVELLRDGQVVETLDLVALEDVRRDVTERIGLWERLRRSLGW